MAFGNISTIYIPTAANAGTSQWGSDVRKFLDSADAASDNTSTTAHGTGGATLRTFDPYTAATADLTQADYGWAINPTDMNSVSGALRYYPAGDHTATIRMNSNRVLAATGTLTMFVYRVGPAPDRTRTLLGSAGASVAFPGTSGKVTAVVTVSLAEVIFEADETVQYSFELSLAGQTTPAVIARMLLGTDTAVESRIDTPTLKVLADTTGTSSGSATVSGVTGKVLGTDGTSSGVATASGQMSTRSDFTGSSSGVATASGQMSSVAGFVGTSAGVGSASGQASIVLGTTGTVEIGAAGGGTTIIKRPLYLFGD